jgi:hypothetical protein
VFEGDVLGTAPGLILGALLGMCGVSSISDSRVGSGVSSIGVGPGVSSIEVGPGVSSIVVSTFVSCVSVAVGSIDTAETGDAVGSAA